MKSQASFANTAKLCLLAMILAGVFDLRVCARLRKLGQGRVCERNGGGEARGGIPMVSGANRRFALSRRFHPDGRTQLGRSEAAAMARRSRSIRTPS